MKKFLAVLLCMVPLVLSAEPLQVLCTTFPICQITRTVTQGSDKVAVSLLIPASLGCPHHYSLTPQDMQKLAKADVLIVNGLGMEEFLGAPVAQANPNLRIIDSSQGIVDHLRYDGHDHGDHEHNHAQKSHSHAHGHAAHGEKHEHHSHGHSHAKEHDHKDAPGHEADADHGHSHSHKHEEQSQGDAHDGHGHNHGCDTCDGSDHHHHSGVNPHLFASPLQSGRLALTIAAGLSAQMPEEASLFFGNATAYAARMQVLADEMIAGVKTLRNNRIVQPHGVFDYLARDIGLEIVAVTQPHGQEPSAAEMLELIKTIRDKDAGAIFTEPQYSPRVGQMLARETGIPTAALDPGASGPADAPLDFFEHIMRKNLETLRTTLGIIP